jgi:two-component sensor histidine kinase
VNYMCSMSSSSPYQWIDCIRSSAQRAQAIANSYQSLATELMTKDSAVNFADELERLAKKLRESVTDCSR